MHCCLVMNDKHDQTQSKPGAPEQQAKREAAAKPTRDDVHEQRQDGQKQEAVVTEAPRRTMQSEIELDRAADEGMTAPPEHEPTARPPAVKPAGKPS